MSDYEEEEYDYQSAKEDAEVERYDAWIEQKGLKHGVEALDRYRNGDRR